jgi:hypothetical protein
LVPVYIPGSKPHIKQGRLDKIGMDKGVVYFEPEFLLKKMSLLVLHNSLIGADKVVKSAQKILLKIISVGGDCY